MQAWRCVVCLLPAVGLRYHRAELNFWARCQIGGGNPQLGGGWLFEWVGWRRTPVKKVQQLAPLETLLYRKTGGCSRLCVEACVYICVCVTVYLHLYPTVQKWDRERARELDTDRKRKPVWLLVIGVCVSVCVLVIDLLPLAEVLELWAKKNPFSSYFRWKFQFEPKWNMILGIFLHIFFLNLFGTASVFSRRCTDVK